MRANSRLFLFVVVLFSITTLVTGQTSKKAETPVKKNLRERCLAAIETNEILPAKRETLKENVMNLELGGGNYHFEFAKSDGSKYFCQMCDDTNPAVDCGMLGLRLIFRPGEGEAQDLPAELDRKCSYFLQKELQEPGARIDHALVDRMQIDAKHTDTRWVYSIHVDEKEYRCVIRKSDGSFRVERKDGEDDWRALAAGTMF